jgi:hypothetical protein
MDAETFRKLLKETRLLRGPKRLLETFGATRIEYHLVSPVEDLPDKTRLREGWVVSERPKILTPQTLRERFEGFGEEAQELSDRLCGEYGGLLRALEYRFKNSDFKTRVLGEKPADTAKRIEDELDERGGAGAALILCPDAAWSLALMKFTLDEASRSFPSHVRRIEGRGLFDADGGAGRRRRAEVEDLFAAAASDPSARSSLGQKLRRYGLFDDYEDRFLSLFR